jgi:hypothetical protein
VSGLVGSTTCDLIHEDRHDLRHWLT